MSRVDDAALAAIAGLGALSALRLAGNISLAEQPPPKEIPLPRADASMGLKPRPDKSAGPPLRRGEVATKPPGRPVTRSTVLPSADVQESPEALLREARAFPGLSDLTLTEYTLARMIGSENARGNVAIWAALGDVLLNRAERRRQTLFEHLVPRGVYGRQGQGARPKRPASTARDPREAHVDVARRLLSGELRGIAKGATRFFDPATQDRLARRGRTCPPLTILTRWAFDYPWATDDQGKRIRCKLNTARPGRQTLAWVGPIDGIDPVQLLLMAPAKLGPEHRRRFEQALAIVTPGVARV